MMRLHPRRGALLGSTSGFTFVELMVVVAIIGILANAAALQVNDVLKKTRDNVRRETIVRLRAALEQYREDKGHYPIMPIGPVSCASDPGGVNDTPPYWCGPEWIPGLAPTYINKLPREPFQGPGDPPVCGPMWPRSYSYISDPSGLNYKVVSHCNSEMLNYPKDDLYDPGRPTWAWQVTNNQDATSVW